MHINDREPDTGSRAPLVWHDYKNGRLNEAFAELAHRRDVLKKRSDRKPFWKRWYVYGPVWLLMVVTAGMPKLTVALGLAGMVFCLIMDFLLPWIAKKRLHALALEIRRGRFGYLVMWEDEPMWEILAAALRPYDIQLTDIFRDDELNMRVTNAITVMLADTWQDRRVLSTYGATSPRGSLALRTLSDHAYVAGVVIKEIYRGYQAEQRNT